MVADLFLTMMVMTWNGVPRPTDMNELKQVFPGIDFDSPLPDITMYFNPDIDPSTLRTLKQQQQRQKRPPSKPMSEAEKKKFARRAALSKKKQEKARLQALMGVEEVGDVVGEEEIAAMRRMGRPGGV